LFCCQVFGQRVEIDLARTRKPFQGLRPIRKSLEGPSRQQLIVLRQPALSGEIKKETIDGLRKVHSPQNLESSPRNSMHFIAITRCHGAQEETACHLPTPW